MAVGQLGVWGKFVPGLKPKARLSMAVGQIVGVGEFVPGLKPRLRSGAVGGDAVRGVENARFLHGGPSRNARGTCLVSVMTCTGAFPG